MLKKYMISLLKITELFLTFLFDKIQMPQTLFPHIEFEVTQVAQEVKIIYFE